MKAIMISVKPNWCADIMNGYKTIEVRKNKALAKAIQKLIDENGYADIYVYCTKEEELFRLNWRDDIWYLSFKRFTDMCCGHLHALDSDNLNGKVLFKFRCDKVEEITYDSTYKLFKLNDVLQNSCLTEKELFNYLKGKNGYAIHISDLEIFDEPKELREFYTLKCNQKDELPCNIKDVFGVEECYRLCKECKQLTKAIQNFCYVEVE